MNMIAKITLNDSEAKRKGIADAKNLNDDKDWIRHIQFDYDSFVRAEGSEFSKKTFLIYQQAAIEELKKMGKIGRFANKQSSIKQFVANEILKIAKSLLGAIHDDVKIQNHSSYGKTYWGRKGLHQKELDELQDADALGTWVRRYYRFYNDGDFPRNIPGIPSYITKEDLKHDRTGKISTDIAKALEYWADDMIMKDWKAYQAKKK